MKIGQANNLINDVNHLFICCLECRMLFHAPRGETKKCNQQCCAQRDPTGLSIAKQANNKFFLLLRLGKKAIVPAINNKAQCSVATHAML